MPNSNFQPIRLLDPDCWHKFTYLMTNSADPDQLASEANWSGSTLFAKRGHIQVQQGKASIGLDTITTFFLRKQDSIDNDNDLLFNFFFSIQWIIPLAFALQKPTRNCFKKRYFACLPIWLFSGKIVNPLRAKQANSMGNLCPPPNFYLRC